MSGVDWPLLRALLVWALAVGLAGWLGSPAARRAVVLTAALLVVYWIPPGGPLDPGRAQGWFWLLVLLALIGGRLDTPTVCQSLLHGLVALASLLLLSRCLVRLAETLPTQGLIWPLGLGLALVGWQLCSRWMARPLDFPLWYLALGMVILGG